MKLRLLIIGWLCLLPALFYGKAYKPEEIPMVHLQNKYRYVCNPDGILSDTAVARMDTTLYALEQETGIQTLVVAVHQIADADCFEFAYQLGKRNGVGQKGKDNGLVILLVTGERCIQFATGYGLEGDLPDAVCKRIQERYMNKSFAAGNWDAGMVNGISALRSVLTGTGEPPLPHGEESDPLGNVQLILILVGLFGIVLCMLWLSIRLSNKCPKCHKYTMHQVSVRTISRSQGVRVEEVERRCSHCGYTERKQRTIRERDNDLTGGMGGGPFIGGFGGGGGGGFSGGSFGGGGFGGGGSGSKF